MIDPQELIDACYKLVPQGVATQPSDADMRRAISAAYYALFHTLAASNADLVAGQPQSDISSYAWERVYRRLEHGRAQNNLRGILSQLSHRGQNFARIYIDLKNQRDAAGYNPNAPILHSHARNVISRAETAIRDFARLSREERRLLTAQSLFDRR